ncbi:MAG: hypothetical protein QOH21_3329 [Acidobacteriota bacterium]|jgi:hypothetical protein|nr:hypothetical protein [Acidobacteriota bacterium]
MKKVLGVLAGIALGLLAYRYGRGAGAEATYKSFAEEVLHRRYAQAAAMAEGLSASDLEKLGSQERIGAGPEMFQALFPSRFRIESREEAGDGAVTLHVRQTVLFNPAGVESVTRPAMFAELAQVVTLRKGDGGWRVVAFSNAFEKMDSVRTR